MKKFTRVAERLVYQNKYIQLFDDQVLTPSGAPGTYTRMRYHDNPPGVVIIPRLPSGQLLLLQVFRYAFDQLSLEFPRGTASPGEPATAAAARELHEETGLAPIHSHSLGFLRPDTAIVETEVEVMLLDLPASLHALTLDADTEAIAGHQLLTPRQLATAIRTHTVRDGFTLGAFALFLAHTMDETLPQPPYL